jgi:hypothetical protein
MKQTTLLKLMAAGAAGAVALTAFAQTESTTTTTTAGPAGVVTEKTTTSTVNGTGTVTAYTPGSDYVMFREGTASPNRYYYTKKTTLVDPEGRQLEWSALRPDMPVTYSYVREGDRMVVTKVTVNKPVVVEKETTTTTTTTKRP